ncbi:MAG TPA: hypothetical protein PLO89_04630, partial [Spirochaetota bacterium]|nr:hypothetical protein [Spirochaetota bacterium]
ESFLNLNLTNFKINFKKGVLIDALLNLDANYQNKINLKTNLILNGEIKEFDAISTVFNIDFKTLNFNRLKFKRQKFVFENSGLNIKLVRLKDSLPLTLEVKKAKSALNVLLKLDNYDIRDFFTDRSINIPNIPDRIYLDANISYDIKEKLTDGKIISGIFYNKIFGFDNIFIDTNLNIFDNVLKVNNLRINNKTRENFVDIKGTIPFKMDNFNFNINFKDFMVKNFKINSAINLKKIKNIITYNSDYLLLNGNDVGGLNVETEIVGKNKINVKSQSDFNGYNFNAEINRGKNYFDILLNNNFNNFNLSRIIKLFVREIKEDFYLNGENSLKITNNNVFFEESLFYVSDSKGDVASFKLMLKNKLFSFYDIFVNKYKVKAKGFLDYNNFPFILNADLTKDDFKLDMDSKIYKDKMIVFLNEKLRSTFYFSKNIVEVKSDSFKIPVKNNEIEINMDFIFDLKNKSIPENIVEIKNLNIFKNEKGNVISKMKFAENKLILEDIVYEDEENKIVGNINHDIVLDEKIVVFGNGFLKDERKGESYSLTYKLADKEVDGKLYVSHLDMKKILGNSISGFLNLRFLVYGNVANPNIDFDGDITEAFFGKSALTGYFSAKKTEDDLFLKRVFLQLGENRVSIRDSDIGLGKDKKKRVNINGNIYLESLSKVLKTDFLIEGEYDKLNPNIDLELNKINLGVLKKGQLASLEKFDNLKFNFSNYEDTYVFKNYGSKIIYFTKKGEETNLKLYNRNEAVLDANIFLGEDNIDGKVSFIKFPVNAVYKVIYPYVGIENGLLDGTFDVKGTRKKPELYGRANLYYGVVNLPQYLQEKIINISGIIVADKNRFLVNNVNGQIRKGNAHGYGEVVFNGLKFERYLFKLSSDIVPALIKAGPVDARGLGKIDDFTIEGRDGVYNFIANLTIDEAEVNLA